MPTWSLFAGLVTYGEVVVHGDQSGVQWNIHCDILESKVHLTLS